jgi:queuosine precursor transporter
MISKETNKIKFKSDLLVAFYIFCIITAELLGSKTFPLFQVFGITLTGAVGMFLIPWVFSINDVFVEVFGFKRAKNLAKISIFIVFLLILLTTFAVIIPPSNRFLPLNDSYRLIFSKSIRISIASLIAIAISNFADINIFWKLKQKLSNQGLWFRNNLSNILAALLDTFIFMNLAFYSLDKPFSNNFYFLLGLIIPYWLLKSCMSAVSTPFVYLGIKWLKKSKK